MFADKSKKLQEAISCYENDEIELAIPLLLDMAGEGCEESNLLLSLIYRDGDGVEKDEVTAKRYKKRYVQIVERKAETDERYRLKLAALLQFGDGVDKDESTALDIYMELAKRGNPEAQFTLYSIFSHGWCGQAEDQVVAKKWLVEAANADWPEAICTLAISLLHEDKSQATMDKVVPMLKKSVELGHWPAEEQLLSLKKELNNY